MIKNRSNLSQAFAFGLLVLLTKISLAQETTEYLISPDRPGGTIYPALLVKGVVNIELGAIFSTSKDKDNNESDAQNYAGLIRFGLLDQCEVNLRLEYSILIYYELNIKK